MDWTGCDLVEVDPEKAGGQPVVKGTRVPAEVVLIDEEYGRTPDPRELSYAWNSDDPLPTRIRPRPRLSTIRVRVLLD